MELAERHAAAYAQSGAQAIKCTVTEFYEILSRCRAGAEEGQKMTKGLEIRAAIDAETVKGLIQINGGGAVAILALLPSIINNLDYVGMAIPLLKAVIFFACGLVCAIVHNQLRRQCSLLHDQFQYQPPPGKFLGYQLAQPTICLWSRTFMWFSMAAFVAGIMIAAFDIYLFVNTVPKP